MSCSSGGMKPVNSQWLCELAISSNACLLYVSSEGCSQPLEPGPCRQYVIKWYYDPEANACAQFWYGGCQGNANNFETEASCWNSCVYT
uniref:BPTI/Kunitz inhibitor domain-containing protein n=1 Tax=Monopterus albus TaxID=43700 RepID=A0A3Q3J9A5_MONAL